MRFRGSTILAAVALMAVTATPVLAARQLGPDLLAKGRGSVETTRTLESEHDHDICDPMTGVCEKLVIARRTQTIVVTQTFDFDARPAGHIKLTQTTTETITDTYTEEGEAYCTPVPQPGCPPLLGTRTTTTTMTATANVTCLTVVQNRATIGGHVIRWSGDSPPSRGLLLTVTDNTVARQQLAADRFWASFLTDVAYECPPPIADHPITRGDIYVDQS